MVATHTFIIKIATDYTDLHRKFSYLLIKMVKTAHFKMAPYSF